MKPATMTKSDLEKLRANGLLQDPVKGTENEIDFHPVVKLFTPWASATWLLTETYPDDPDIAFGLCDLGHGFPELGCVALSEITALRGPGGLRVEKDRHFTAKQPLSAYAENARSHRQIIT